MVTIVRLVHWLGVLLLLATIVAGLRAWDAYQNSTVIVDWNTASELDTAGFNIYRSIAEDGPFEQLNEGLIPASSDPFSGGTYQYTDRNVEPGRTYYYQLEAVETGSSSTRYGPVHVKAEPGGKVEAVLAIALAISGVFLVFSTRPSKVLQIEGGS